MVPIRLLLDIAALCTIKTGCHWFSILAARSQGFTLHSLLTMVSRGFLMAGCIWAPACSAAPVRALLCPGPASLGRPARNQVEEQELNKLQNYFQACSNRVLKEKQNQSGKTFLSLAIRSKTYLSSTTQELAMGMVS